MFVMNKTNHYIFSKMIKNHPVTTVCKITKILYSACKQNNGAKRPLDGIRVLDLSRILAGPFCTMLLGDLGAEIIKVENPDGGDETRNWGPPFVDGESAYFLSVNRNKKSIAINMKEESGCRIIKELAMKSDILIENFIPGKLSTYGLDYESLHKKIPHLIYCSITGYGSTGPYCNRAGYDVIAASVGGLLSITGSENGDPCKVGVAMTDLATGLYAHGAIMAALLQKSITGLGQKIDCDLLSTQVSLLANIGSNYLNARKEAKRWGTAHESIVPYQSFKTKNGYITVGAGSDKQFKVLCKCLGCEELSIDPLFNTNENRVKNRKHLLSILTDKFSKFSTIEWLKKLDGSGIPYGPVNSIADVFSDPQILHNKMIIEMEHSKAGQIKLTGPAIKFSDSINEPRTPPPVLGEHTDSILSNTLSYSKEEISSLKNLKVIL